MDAAEPLLHRTWRFIRALIVGSFATLTDFAVLTLCLHVLSVTPQRARLPALLAGAVVQFFGNRSFTFRAQGGHVSRQAVVYALVESVGMACNWGCYQLLLKWLPLVPPEVVSFLGTSVVFLCFSYPMQRLVVFKVPRAAPGPRDARVVSGALADAGVPLDRTAP